MNMDKAIDIAKEIPENAVIIMCGLPATGKSTIAKGIAKTKDITLLSSDIIRLEILKGEDIFDQKVASDMNKRLMVYELMFDRAGEIIKKGRGVILDATFIKQDLRKKVALIAHKNKRPFYIIETRCAPEIAIKRIKNRSKDKYESNAITEDAYLNNLRIFEPVDIRDICNSLPGIRSFYFLINTDTEDSKNWFIEKKEGEER